MRSWTRSPRLPFVLMAAMAVVVLVGGAATVLRTDDLRTMPVCADFDTVYGLFDDAAVTIRGIPVGVVESVGPAGGHVRVQMSIDRRQLPRGTRAVVVNSSILADRRVELVDSVYRGGATLGARCIGVDHTEVPVDVSDALQSFSGLVDHLTAPAANGDAPLEVMVAAADEEFDGMGPTLNREFRALADLMADPDGFMGQLGRLLDNSSALTGFLDQEWDQITVALKTFGPGLELLQKTLVIVKVLVEKLAAAVEPMDRLFNQHFPYLMEMLESGVPAITLVRTNIDESRDLLGKIPAIILMLRSMIEDQPGTVSTGYRPPASVVDAANPAQLCAALNRGSRDMCRVMSARTAAVPLTQVVLASIGGVR